MSASAVLAIGFTESSSDYALFTRRTPRGITLLLLYVDDMVISGDDADSILSLKQQFQMGHLRDFLGLEVAYAQRGYLVSQQKYTSDLISRACLTDTRTAATPIELHHRLSSSDGELLSDPTRYRQIVGALVYLTISRPDIAYAVRVLSQFVSAPRSTHYAALLRVLRFLRPHPFSVFLCLFLPGAPCLL